MIIRTCILIITNHLSFLFLCLVFECFTAKLNLIAKLGLTYAISVTVVNWSYGILLVNKFVLLFFTNF